MIGDPSGKSEERNLQSKETLDANVRGCAVKWNGFWISRVAPRPSSSTISIGQVRGAILNSLRDVGKNFPVSVMLSKDSVKSRIEREGVGISYTEFSYMLLQAYDFVHLSRTYGCKLQVGAAISGVTSRQVSI